jgi:hypothetical protein
MGCQCESRGFVRCMEEEEAGLTENVAKIGATREAALGRCRQCGAWWERVPHYVYGYAWYRTEQRYWDAQDEAAAVAGWASSRREWGL